MLRFLLPFFLFCAFCSSAQHFCQTTEKQQEWFSKHPELKAAFEKHRKELAELDKQQYKDKYKTAAKSAAAGVYTIPVVFHILHTGTGENISDAQVIDAVNILTRDFNCANTDTSDVVGPFKNLVGNAQFDFMLATKDPNGNCTNGIVRHYDANTDWDGDFADYAYTWPPTKYLNIYVVRSMDGGAAGYTFLPGSGIPSQMDAIVILSNYVGSIGTGFPSTSRALTHEVGHWFDLEHTWGFTNSPGVACGDDGISDTPVTKGYTSCNLVTCDICNPGIDENVQNYMEYAYCDRMFTIGQVARMHTTINGFTNGRNNLSSSGNLASTGITSPATSCSPGLDIAASPNFTACSGKLLTLSGFTYNAVPLTYSWTVSGGVSPASPSSRSTTVVFPNPGVYSVSCTASNVNGSVTKTMTLLIQNGVTQVTTGLQEGFESGVTAPPAQWTVINPTTPAQKWELSTTVGSQGTKCMYVPGESMNPSTVEILESPSYDFKNNPGAQFSFKYAYAMKSSANRDRFRVQASKDCGTTWLDVWNPTNYALAQNSGGTRSALFVPVANEWKLKVLTQQPQFAPFWHEQHVSLRFYFQEDTSGVGHGNRFYLDEIVFETAVGVNELTNAIGLEVFPNPASPDFRVKFQLPDASRIKYSVMTISGAIVLQSVETEYAPGSHELILNANGEFSPGIYFVDLSVNGVRLSRKVVVN